MGNANGSTLTISENPAGSPLAKPGGWRPMNQATPFLDRETRCIATTQNRVPGASILHRKTGPSVLADSHHDGE